DRTKTLAASIVGASTQSTGLELPVQFSPRNPVLTGTQQSTTTSSTSTSSGTTTTPTTTPTQTTTPTTTSSSSTTQSQYISLAQIGKVGFNDYSIALPGALLQAIMSDSTTRIMQSPQ